MPKLYFSLEIDRNFFGMLTVHHLSNDAYTFQVIRSTLRNLDFFDFGSQCENQTKFQNNTLRLPSTVPVKCIYLWRDYLVKSSSTLPENGKCYQKTHLCQF